MLKNRRILYIGIAVLLAFITVSITQQWLQRESDRVGAAAQVRTPETSARVLVAAQGLPPGTILQRDHLIWQPWPAEAALESYFTDPGSGTGAADTLVGAVVRQGLARGEPLTREGVVHPGERSFLAAVLRPGYRAVSIAVTASTGVSGFIRPGDRVDVILSRVLQGGGAPRVVTDTILSNVRVVGIDQRVASGGEEVIVPQTATLEVTSTQAEAIAAASELGKLSLALRSLAAAEGEEPEGAVVTPFWRGAPSVSTARPPARARRSAPRERSEQPTRGVEVIRGESVSVEGSSR